MSGHEVHHPGLGELLWPAVNFTIFVWLIARYLWGPIKEYFRERTERLREELAAGARARADAEALRAQLAREIAALPEERRRLESELRAIAEREATALLAFGRQAAERLRTDARLATEHEVRMARETLRAEVVDEAVRQAVALVRDALGPEDHVRLVREFADAVRTAA